MFDLAALAIAAACFAFIVLLLYVLERVWCRPPTSSAWRSRSPSSPTWSTHCSAGSAS